MPRPSACLAPLAAILLLAGCAPRDDEFPPACPALSLVPDADRIVRFAGAGRDAADIVYEADITNVPARCERDGATAVRATLHVEADLRGGLAARSDTAAVPYFVALTEGGKVLQEQDFQLGAELRASGTATKVRGEDVELLLPVTAAKSAAAYRIHVGFRLSPEELAFNRAHAR